MSASAPVPSDLSTEAPAAPAAPAAEAAKAVDKPQDVKDKSQDVEDKSQDKSQDEVDNPKGEASAPDWAELRAKYANGDEKLLKRLARYSSTEAALDALIAAQNKIASGGLKTALAEDATPEEKAAWRADNGIPESPDAYEIQVPDDVELDERGESALSELAQLAHDVNMKPDQLQRVADYLFEAKQKQEAAQAEADEAVRETSVKALKEEMGSEYTLNLNLINGLLDLAPAGLKDRLLGARLGDGTPLGSDKETIRWLANLSREINPVATVVPTSGLGAEAAITTELENIQAMMGDSDSEYWKGPKAKGLQDRFRQLVGVKQKIAKR